MKKTKLLLIDDERPLLFNLKRILEFEEYEVITAFNGIEGLQQYESELPDLIICDIMMPDMDGYHFIESLRSKGYTNTPFIFLTAKSEYDDLRTGMSFGADDYLVKPVKSAQLIDAINTRLMRKKEINLPLEQKLQRLENGFTLITNQEFFATINDIISYLQLLKNKSNKTIDDIATQEYMNYIEKSINRLLQLLNKVKYWRDQEENIPLKSTTTEYVHTKELVEKACKIISEKYNRESDLISDIQGNVRIRLTKDIFETLLIELIDNAFKFSEKGNPIIINTAVEEAAYIITIADCGKNSDAESLIAFKPFSLDAKPIKHHPGIGLGLAIAHIIIKNAKGTIEITDNKPCGILVKISLPIVI